jgi:hypothetical protein
MIDDPVRLGYLPLGRLYDLPARPTAFRADSGDCGQVFRLIADTDSDRLRTAFR